MPTIPVFQPFQDHWIATKPACIEGRSYTPFSIEIKPCEEIMTYRLNINLSTNYAQCLARLKWSVTAVYTLLWHIYNTINQWCYRVVHQVYGLVCLNGVREVRTRILLSTGIVNNCIILMVRSFCEIEKL